MAAMADQAGDTTMAVPRARAAGPTAVDAWTQLLEGGWRLCLESSRLADGLASAKRSRASSERIPLSIAERQVVEAVARGLSNKLIAFDLGIPEGTVATRLLRARLKLGVTTRVEVIALAQATRGRRPADVIVDGALALERIAFAARERRPSELPTTLSTAERAVAELASQGRSNREIARMRGTSTSTVANQLGRIYAKLGINSRAELTATRLAWAS